MKATCEDCQTPARFKLSKGEKITFYNCGKCGGKLKRGWPQGAMVKPRKSRSDPHAIILADGTERLMAYPK